jgi:hypothetical protein
MTKDWVKMGEDLGVGLVAGAADQFVQNKDDDRAKAKSTETPVGELAMQSQYSTYLNFGLPILKGEWATRMTTVSGQLVGRKLVHKFSSEKHLKGYPGSDNSVGYSASSGYERARELEARRQKEITVIPGRTVSVMEI